MRTDRRTAHRWGMAALTAALTGCIPHGDRRPPDVPSPASTASAATRVAHTDPSPTGPRSAEPRPVWDVDRVTPDARTVAAQTVTVRPGETLGAIGIRTGAGTDAIARANGLAYPYRVTPGQRLDIPGGRYHLVRAGETGIAIARAYGEPWSRFIAENGFTEPYLLRVGQRVRIPGGAPTRADRAAAFTLDIDEILTGGEPAVSETPRPSRMTRAPGRTIPATVALAPPARLVGGFAWPADGRVVTRFGPGASGERNDGINVALPRGTPVRAAADGVVAYAGEGIPSLGDLLIVKHGNNWTSVYGNASRLLVRRGDPVTRGQTIALSGDTGAAERPQLHFELRRGRQPVDPLGQLPGR